MVPYDVELRHVSGDMSHSIQIVDLSATMRFGVWISAFCHMVL